MHFLHSYPWNIAYECTLSDSVIDFWGIYWLHGWVAEAFSVLQHCIMGGA